MTVVNYRILINAPPELVWELLGDLTATPKWHVNCTQARIVTTQQEGAGVRYRLSMKNGPDIVQEILSWYRNLGYEYTVVDGPFKTSRGHIRLQPIYEGTIVQWTLEYELGGFAAGLRDAGVRRKLEGEFEDSLKRLKKLIEATGIRMDDETRARVTMRPAPTAKERAELAENFARTHPAMRPVEGDARPETRPPEPTLPHVTPIIDEGDLPPAPQPVVIGDDDLPPTPIDDLLLTEPPISDEDTRPRPAAPQESATAAPEPDPDLTESVAPVAPPVGTDAGLTEPATPVVAELETTPDDSIPVVEITSEVGTPVETLAETVPEAPEPVETAVIEPVAVASSDAPEPEASAAEAAVSGDNAAGDQPAESQPPAQPEVEQAAYTIRQKSLFEEDLKPMGPSIWDVFGMPAPDAESAPAAPQATPAPPETPAAQAPPAHTTTPETLEERLAGHLLRISRIKRKHPGLRRLLGRSVMIHRRPDA